MRPQWLGRQPYRRVHGWMQGRRRGVIEGWAPEAFWLVEHPSVITTGRRSAEDVPDAAWLAARGTDRVDTERGGLATWHGPGQLVGYPIVHLPSRGLGVRVYVEALQAGIIFFLQGEGIDAHLRDGAPGVWVGNDKICAIGIHVSRGVTLHGFALNLHPDLTPFSWFVPCGIQGAGVTSVEQLTGRRPDLATVAEQVGASVLDAMSIRKR